MTGGALKCPTCGAPLHRQVNVHWVTCQYCKTQVETGLPVVPPPVYHAPPRSAYTLQILVVVGLSLFSFGSYALRSLFSGPSSPPVSATPPAPDPTAAAQAKKLTLARLGLLDIAMNVDTEKSQMPVQFPEAEPDMHRIEYSFLVDHPLFSRGNMAWEWGCSCLDRFNLFLKDYPTELAAPKTLVPCLVEKLGALNPTSTPPYHYYWTVVGVGDVSFGPNDLSLSPKKGVTTQQGFRQVLAAVEACGHQ